MGDTLSGIMGGGQKSQGMQAPMQQPQRAQEQILSPMSGAPPMMMGAQNMNFNNPQQQPQNFGSSPTNALSNIGRRF